MPDLRADAGNWALTCWLPDGLRNVATTEPPSEERPAWSSVMWAVTVIVCADNDVFTEMGETVKLSTTGAVVSPTAWAGPVPARVARSTTVRAADTTRRLRNIRT